MTSTIFGIYFCFIDYAKSFDGVDHNKLWKILKESADVNVNCYSHYRKQNGNFVKTAKWYSNPISRYIYPEEVKCGSLS